MAQTDIDRRRLLAGLFPDQREYLFVAGLAGSARDAAMLTEDGGNLFALGGVMGAATTIGLGMALAAPEHKIVVVTGDGELQMNIGSLITVASTAPANLTIVCIDNEGHGETGNQRGHTAGAASIELMGKSAGITSTMTIMRSEEITKAASFIGQARGPCLLVVKVLATEPSAYKRLMDPAACRYRFKAAFAAAMRR